MPFVLDASVALSWCFANEVTDYSDRVLGSLSQTTAQVPIIWPLEVANVLLLAERHRRITEAQATYQLGWLLTLPITIDAEGVTGTLGSAVTLAREHQLSLYDACYLELAMREGLPLATQDTQLRAAAVRSGVADVE
jgi:predicted nucleic acid-binding protein